MPLELKIILIALGAVAFIFVISIPLYKCFFKRFYDIVLSFLAIVVLSPFLLIFIIVGAIAMGGNPFFTQNRPGKNEKIFKLIKFRSMNNKKDKDGNLLPDEARLTKYGKFLRATSLDELPEIFNIFVGHMSIVGPRPLLVKYLPLYSEEQRKRHNVRPGLTGHAQVNGRNNISWEEKFEWDIKYIESGITFIGDVRIILKTVGKVLCREDTVRQGTVSDLDFGDWLLQKGEVTENEYNELQSEAKELLRV